MMDEELEQSVEDAAAVAAQHSTRLVPLAQTVTRRGLGPAPTMHLRTFGKGASSQSDAAPFRSKRLSSTPGIGDHFQ